MFKSHKSYCTLFADVTLFVFSAGNYLVRFIFSAIGTAVCLPAIQAIGVGWFSTCSAGILVLAAGGVYITIQRGARWRDDISANEQRKLVGPRGADGREAREKL